MTPEEQHDALSNTDVTSLMWRLVSLEHLQPTVQQKREERNFCQIRDRKFETKDERS